jgi:hypothetical protein
MMRSANLTEHAQKRRQQRGVSELQIELISAFGSDWLQKGGCTLARISEAKVRDLRRALDGLEKLSLIKSPTEQVITVMHQARRVRATQYVA